jgi:hypothetical protein
VNEERILQALSLPRVQLKHAFEIVDTSELFFNNKRFHVIIEEKNSQLRRKQYH